ncbi:MAG TPA: ATP-binding protein [Anaeromyxobacter sp.]|nr:ATP-binding protein [Anaeromyxobacter sp.]
MTSEQAHVLFVEDNEATRYAVNRVLANAGYRVTAASEGDRGLALALADRPDLVLLDVRLPGASGFEICRELKRDESTRGIPVVFLSASHVSAQDKVAGLEGGADMYLTHPVEPHVLVASLGALMRVRRAEAKYRRLAGSNVVGVAEFDLDGRILDANDEYLRITGRTRADVAEGRLRWSEVIAPDLHAVTAAGADELRRTGAMAAHELEFLRPDGTRVPVIRAAASVGRGERGISVVLDISERRRAEREREEALARAEAAQARLGFLLSVSNALMAAQDDPDDALRRVAALCTGMICDACIVDRIPEPGTVTRAAVAAAPPDRRDAAAILAARPPRLSEGAIGRALASGDVQRLRDVRDAALLQPGLDAEGRRALDALGTGAIAVHPLISHGRILGGLTLVRRGNDADLSPIDAALGEEVALRAAMALDAVRLRDELTRAVRAREDALAEVSHELRNPLSSVLLASLQLERAVERPDLPDLVKRRAATVRRSGERMNRLVNDLLDLARIESGHLTLDAGRHDVAQLLLDAVEAAHAQAGEHGAKLEVSAPPGLQLECDRDRIHRVLVNLLSNAAKASPRGGRVVASARADGQDVVFTVSDEGPGIPAELRDHLFERFWRGRQPGEGVGLGLSIAKALVESHGGAIWTAEAPGGGAVFAFRLPAAQPHRERPAGSER